ncbi:MAG: hypothetical protein FWC41_06735 [Firmicutes bacterium]|nr:hypothetical protein [Bacillota bacterium]
MDIHAILIAVLSFISGGGLLYIFTLKSSKRKANYEADNFEYETLFKKHSTLKEIETLNINRIEELTEKFDKQVGLVLDQKDVIMNLKMYIKDIEEQMKNLETKFNSIKKYNDELKKENAEIREKVKHFCFDENCKKRKSHKN